HGEIQPLNTMSWLKSRLSRVRISSWFVNEIITVSEANRQYLRAMNVRKPVKLIYNGIDVPRFLEHVDPSRPIGARCDPQRFKICYMGSLIPRKRPDDLLRAFALVCAERPDARLTIVGGGYLDLQLKRLCSELNLDEAVEFKGKILEFPFD